MKTTVNLVLALLATCACVHAQVVPAATGPGGSPLGGNLNYSLRYSQTAQFGDNLGDSQTSSASASVSYANGKERLPFNLEYGGGYNWTIAGPSYSTGFFQHLLLSQGIVWRKWNITISDDVSYTPQAPTIGFSGIPGIGEPIGEPNPAPPSSQSILTLNTHVINNATNVELGHQLNYAATFSAGGSSELLRYPDGNGLNTDTQTANAGLSWRLNARNSISSNYTFSRFSYPDYDISFETNSTLFGFSRQWNRKVNTNFSAGPDWTSSSQGTGIPSSMGVGANAAVNYQLRSVTAALTYSRAINGGAGYLIGGESDSVNANLTQQFGRNLNIGFDGSYRRTQGLQNNGVTDAKVAGAQVTRRVGRYLSAFANYTATTQSSSSTLPGNTLSGLMQTVGFGIGYSPRETHLRH